MLWINQRILLSRAFHLNILSSYPKDPENGWLQLIDLSRMLLQHFMYCIIWLTVYLLAHKNMHPFIPRKFFKKESLPKGTWCSLGPNRDSTSHFSQKLLKKLLKCLWTISHHLCFWLSRTVLAKLLVRSTSTATLSARILLRCFTVLQ